MKDSVLQKLAEFVSNVFSPVVLLPLLFLIYLYSARLESSQILYAFVVVFGLGVVPTLGILLLFKKFKLISDWDISQRKQRYLFNAVVFVVGMLVLVSLSTINAIAIFRFASVIMFWFAGFSLITFFWKISAHTGSAMLFYLLSSVIVGFYSPIYFLFVPLVAWSRIYTHNHTVLQTIGGIILSTVIFFVSKFLRFI